MNASIWVTLAVDQYPRRQLLKDRFGGSCLRNDRSFKRKLPMPLSSSTQGGVFFLVSFPSGWPLAQAAVLFQRIEGTSSITACAGIDGRICVTLIDQGLTEKEWIFQPFQLTTGTRVVIYIGWCGDDAECRVNSYQLLPDIGRCLAGIMIEGKRDVRSPRVLQYPRIQASDGTHERDRFFLETVRDLDRKLCEPETYALLRAAALLRQLLLDGLIHDVNRVYRCKLLFDVYAPSEAVPVPPTLHIRSIDPAQHPNRQYQSLNIDQFLALVVATPLLSVRHIVKTCANAKGGVHLGGAKEDFANVVLQMDQGITVGGQEPSLNLLAEIGNVTLQSIRPLVGAIQARCAQIQRPQFPSFDGKRPAYRIADKSRYWLGTKLN